MLRDDFRVEPQSTRVAVGEDIVLECVPPRGTPEPQVTWRKDGRTLDLGGRLKIVDGSSLAITDARTTDDGRYQCVARNTAGIRESAVAMLKVHGRNYFLCVVTTPLHLLFDFSETFHDTSTRRRNCPCRRHS